MECVQKTSKRVVFLSIQFTLTLTCLVTLMILYQVVNYSHTVKDEFVYINSVLGENENLELLQQVITTELSREQSCYNQGRMVYVWDASGYIHGNEHCDEYCVATSESSMASIAVSRGVGFTEGFNLTVLVYTMDALSDKYTLSSTNLRSDIPITLLPPTYASMLAELVQPSVITFKNNNGIAIVSDNCTYELFHADCFDTSTIPMNYRVVIYTSKEPTLTMFQSYLQSNVLVVRDNLFALFVNPESFVAYEDMRINPAAVAEIASNYDLWSSYLNNRRFNGMMIGQYLQSLSIYNKNYICRLCNFYCSL